MSVMKIEAFVQPFRLDAVKAALNALSVEAVSYCHVMDCGRWSGLKAFYRGVEYFVDSPRLKLEVLVSSLDADEVITAITEAARTGHPSDDGLILVSKVADAHRIQAGRRVRLALT
jgi:nitrogen regulatory protein PII